MSRPLRVLLLEDRQDDARLILRELRRAVSSRSRTCGGRNRIPPSVEPDPEIILADYHLPSSMPWLCAGKERAWTYPSSSSPAPSVTRPLWSA